MSVPIPIKPTRRRAYVRNVDLLREIAASKTKGKINNELAKMLMMMSDKFFSKGNYRNYTFNDELRCEGLAALVYAVLRFNETRSQNPFAYLTTCLSNAGNKILNREKRQRVIRDELLVMHGARGSHTSELEYQIAEQKRIDDAKT